MVSVGLGWGAVAEAGVQPAGVVPAFDPLEDGPVESGAGGPRPGVDEFAFDGREERLGHRVVPTLPATADREDHAVVPSEGRVVPARILAAPVRVEDEPCGRASLDEC